MRTSATGLNEAATTQILGFQNRDATFVRVRDGSRTRTFPVDGPECRHWMARLAHTRGETTSRAVLADAQQQLSFAVSDGKFSRISTAVRAAQVDDAVWIDLGDQDGRVARVAADGWSIVSDVECPVGFLRSHSMLPLPVPETGGDLDRLWPLARLHRDEIPVVAAWMVTAVLTNLQCPILFFSGAHGTAKTFASRSILKFVDPREGGLSVTPDTRNDMISIANGRRVVGLENVSKVGENFSDTLCALVTGTSGAARRKYSNWGESQVAVRSAVLMNGIDLPENHPDLLERTVVVRLQQIQSADRRPETEVNAELDRRAPQLMGAFLDLVAGVLRELPTIQRNEYGRMADFERVVFAAGKCLGYEEEQLSQILRRREAESRGDALDNNVCASVLCAYLDAKLSFDGTATQLLSELHRFHEQQGLWTQRLPATPQHMTSNLNRVSGELEARGYSLTHSRSPDAHSRKLISARKLSVTDDERAESDNSSLGDRRRESVPA